MIKLAKVRRDSAFLDGAKQLMQIMTLLVWSKEDFPMTLYLQTLRFLLLLFIVVSFFLFLRQHYELFD